WIWLICAWNLLGLTFGVLGTTILKLSADGLPHGDKFFWIEATVGAIVWVFNMTGTVYLFRMRAQAYPLFLWAFRIALVLYAYYALFTDYWSAFSGQQLVGILIGAFIWIAILLYVR